MSKRCDRKFLALRMARCIEAMRAMEESKRALQGGLSEKQRERREQGSGSSDLGGLHGHLVGQGSHELIGQRRLDRGQQLGA